MFKLLLAALLCANSFGQPGAHEISGKILDQSGGPIQQVKVTLKPVDDPKRTKIKVTLEDGTFVFTQIPENTYDLRFEMAGFKSKTVRSIKVDTTRIVKIGTVTLDIDNLYDPVVITEQESKSTRPKKSK